MNHGKIFALALLVALPLAARAETGRLTLPDFSHLAGKAKESVDINLDGDMLKTAGQFMGASPQGAPPEVQQALQGLTGVYVRVFEFEQPGMYSDRDLAKVRGQLQAPGWKKLMSVQSKDEHVDMYLRDGGARPEEGGIALVVSEPKEFVVVNIVGKVDLETLRALQGKLGVPAMPGTAPAAASAPAPVAR